MRFSEIEKVVAEQLGLPLLAVKQCRIGRRPRCHQDVGIAREICYTIAKMDGQSLSSIARAAKRHSSEVSRDIARFRRRVAHDHGYARVLEEIVESIEGLDTEWHCRSCGQRLAFAPEK